MDRRAVLALSGTLLLPGCTKVVTKGAKIASNNGDEVAKGSDEVAGSADEAVKWNDEVRNRGDSVGSGADDTEDGASKKVVSRIKRERREEKIEQVLEEETTTTEPFDPDYPVSLISDEFIVRNGYYRSWSLNYSGLAHSNADRVIVDYTVNVRSGGPVDVFLLPKTEFTEFKYGLSFQYLTHGSNVGVFKASTTYFADFEDYAFIVDNTATGSASWGDTTVRVDLTGKTDT